jgi:hypothetical protein
VAPFSITPVTRKPGIARPSTLLLSPPLVPSRPVLAAATGVPAAEPAPSGSAGQPAVRFEIQF